MVDTSTIGGSYFFRSVRLLLVDLLVLLLGLIVVMLILLSIGLVDCIMLRNMKLMDFAILTTLFLEFSSFSTTTIKMKKWIDQSEWKCHEGRRQRCKKKDDGGQVGRYMEGRENMMEYNIKKSSVERVC